MSHDQEEDDKTTTIKMAYTFAAFVVLGIFLIILANIIG